MSDLWKIAQHEYLKIVRKRSFLLATLGIPAMIVIITGITILTTLGFGSDQPLGYVDRAGVLDAARVPTPEMGRDPVPMRAYANEESARRALEAEEIQAFYVLPEDYLESGYVELYYREQPPGELVKEDFASFVRVNLVEDLPEEVQNRILGGTNVTVRAATGDREFRTENFLNFLLPFAASFFFTFAVMNSGGYMLQAVTEEKENRTIEILATSVRPAELIGGKALGLMGVGLSQLALWVGTVILGLLAASPFVEAIQQLNVPWTLVAIVAIFFLPAYALVAGMMTAVGGAVTELRQGQQISGILNMLFTFPFLGLWDFAGNTHI